MSSKTESNLNIILGQLEDELRAIKSARMQTDDVISASSELATTLERVIAETRTLVNDSNNQTRAAADSLTSEVNRLTEQSKRIERLATDGTDAIAKQAADARTSLQDTADSIAGSLSDEAERMTQELQAMQEASAQIPSLVQKQAEDAQSALNKATDEAVDALSDQTSRIADETITSIGRNVDKASEQLYAAVKPAEEAAASIQANGKALLEANEIAKTQNKRQNTETRALLEETQKHLAGVDAAIATLKEIDVDSLAKEIRELKTIESNNTATLKSRLTIATVMAGACIVLCIAVLARLIIG